MSFQGQREQARATPAHSPPAIAEVCFAIGLAVLGLYVAWQGTSFGGQIGYMPIGPAVFPVGVGLLLFLVSTVMAVSAWRRHVTEPIDMNWRPFLKVLGLFAAYLVLLNVVGFLIATPLFFAGTSRVLDAKRPYVDLAVGVVLTGIVFVGFRYGLNVRLPMGELWSILAGARS